MVVLKIAWQLLEQYVDGNSARSGLDVSSFFRSVFSPSFAYIVSILLCTFSMRGYRRAAHIYLFIYDVMLLCIHFQCHEIMSHNGNGDDVRCFDIHLNILYVGFDHLSFNLILGFFVEVCGCVRSRFMWRCLDAYLFSFPPSPLLSFSTM